MLAINICYCTKIHFHTVSSCRFKLWLKQIEGRETQKESSKLHWIDHKIFDDGYAGQILKINARGEY